PKTSRCETTRAIVRLIRRSRLFFVAHKDQAKEDTHARDERHHNADGEDREVAHLMRLPRLRMLGTQMPTKMACCRLRSVSPMNQSETLNTKLMNAAAMKKY
ncbi:MAG: hypothetical protein ACOYMC_12410, partial [Pirellulales bacterium]